MGIATSLHLISDGTPGGTHIYDEAGNDISGYFVGAQVVLRADSPHAKADLYVAPAVIRTIDMTVAVSSAIYRCAVCGNPLPPTTFALPDERKHDRQGEQARIHALEEGDDPL